MAMTAQYGTDKSVGMDNADSRRLTTADSYVFVVAVVATTAQVGTEGADASITANLSITVVGATLAVAQSNHRNSVI